MADKKQQDQDMSPFVVGMPNKKKKMTPLEAQEQGLELIVKQMSQEDQQKISDYVDRFSVMLNKGQHLAQLAFTIVGIELTKLGEKHKKKTMEDAKDETKN